MTHNESDGFLLLVGGPRHGETIQIPQKVNFNTIDLGDIDGTVLYTVCQAGDGRFYAVFNPSSRDPSVARIEALRAMIRGAL